MSLGERRRLLGAFALGAALATAIVVAQWRSDPAHRTAYGDGLIYRFVAAHIGAGEADVARFDPDRVVIDRGTSLRYGRIGMPALVWLVSGGKASVMPTTQPIVMIVAAGFACAGVAALFPRGGPLSALLPFLAPGFPLAIAGGYAECVAVAFGVWAVWLALRDRWWPSALLLGAAILTKENAAVIMVGLGIWLLVRKRWQPAFILAAGAVPVVAYWLFIANRFGHIPPLDPYLRVATTTIGTPVVALIQSFTDAYSTESIVVALIHIAAGAVVIALLRSSIYALIGSVAALQLLAVGPFGWRFIGDATRISTIFEVFVILAIATRMRPAATLDEAVSALG
ncbi:MAG: hypothetical protein WAT66_00340 [Actinomycetota bacterium]